jgi:TolB-like protein/DNA-binding winged helix-turn-helix (wHTH) protein/Tfp pilus assembly protein PilF
MPTSAPAARRLRFDDFELDVRAGQLRKRGFRLRLQGQPLQVLAVLLNRAGEVVTREELRSQIWSADTFVDFDHSLHNAIARIREALGDSAETPRYIETLPRRGYRFLAPAAPNEVETQATPGSVHSAPGPQPSVASDGLRRTSAVMALAFLILAVSGLAFWRLRASADHASAAARPGSIAVLPLDNLSGDPSQDYFVDGVTEQLITDLAQVGSLRVVSRTSVMQYKGTKKRLPEIAQELNVDAVVAGSVMRSGQRIRVTAQLVQASTDQHLWAETYDRDLGDVLRLQGEVAQSIAERVRAQLTPEQKARLRSAPAVNPEAYEAYLKGRFYGAGVTGTRAALKQAQGYYEDAVRKDPTFALAYAGLADCYLYQGTFRLVPPQDAYRQASAAILKALQLDKALAEAHTSIGMLDWRFEWNWQPAERELRYAVEVNPNSMESHEALVWYLAWSGREAEARAEVEKMRQLDPAYPFIPQQETGIYYHQRNYKLLLEASEKSVAAYPNGWVSHYFLAVGYEGSGRPAQAIPEYQRAVELSEGDTDSIAGLAHAYAVVGSRTEAEKILRELQTRSKTDYISPYMIVVIYAGLGNKDKTFEFLEKAYKEKSSDIAYFLKADFRIDPLRSDPRFQDLLGRVNFPQ